MYYVLRTTYYVLRTTYYVPRTTYYVLRTPYYVLRRVAWIEVCLSKIRFLTQNVLLGCLGLVQQGHTEPQLHLQAHQPLADHQVHQYPDHH